MSPPGYGEGAVEEFAEELNAAYCCWLGIGSKLDALEGSVKELSRVECEGATGTGAGTSA